MEDASRDCYPPSLLSIELGLQRAPREVAFSDPRRDAKRQDGQTGQFPTIAPLSQEEKGQAGN